jgi:hypothetical protein
MPTIQIDPDVMSLIWGLRKAHEESETDILRRVLTDWSVKGANSSPIPLEKELNTSIAKATTVLEDRNDRMSTYGKIRWVDDVKDALCQLGGAAALHEIYKQVRRIRREGGRSTPTTLEATIRRTIEDHSSDSDNFRGDDIFKKVSRGYWALR